MLPLAFLVSICLEFLFSKFLIQYGVLFILCKWFHPWCLHLIYSSTDLISSSPLYRTFQILPFLLTPDTLFRVFISATLMLLLRCLNSIHNSQPSYEELKWTQSPIWHPTPILYVVYYSRICSRSLGKHLPNRFSLLSTTLPFPHGVFLWQRITSYIYKKDSYLQKY